MFVYINQSPPYHYFLVPKSTEYYRDVNLILCHYFQLNAGKAADKKFTTTLKSAGIDEDFLRSRGSASPTTRYGEYDDEDEDDDNATYTKSMHREEEDALS